MPNPHPPTHKVLTDVFYHRRMAIHVFGPFTPIIRPRQRRSLLNTDVIKVAKTTLKETSMKTLVYIILFDNITNEILKLTVNSVSAFSYSFYQSFILTNAFSNKGKSCQDGRKVEFDDLKPFLSNCRPNLYF